jgi:[protein-PII] uridylyltransferase
MTKPSHFPSLYTYPLPEADEWLALQTATISQVKPWLETQRVRIKQKFFNVQNPQLTLKHLTEITDHLIHYLCQCAHQHLGIQRAPICIAALGGYGRKQLFPFSDIDILCVYKPHQEQHATEISGFILHVLWDLGFHVGHSIRTLPECYEAATQDHTVLTALLDARYIAGNQALFQKLTTDTIPSVVAQSNTKEFIEAKLKERDKRHERSGDSRYILEPNIKENKGALRDLHTLFWIAHYVYGIERIHDLIALGKITENEYTIYKRARQFLWIVRIYLHYFANRPEERLTFDMQRRIADVMGYRGKNTNQAVERFMKRYFHVARDVGTLTGLFCATLEAEQIRRVATSPYKRVEENTIIDTFIIRQGRLHFESFEHIQQSPQLIIKLFHSSCMEGLPIHPRALQWVVRSLHTLTKDIRSQPLVLHWFLEILMHAARGHATLRIMNDNGVLGKLIPDFAHIVGQMQFDMYHIYTVDEHTLNAIGILHAIERGEIKQELPLSSHIMPLLRARHVLYIALFCHDIAKGRGGNHEEKGIPIAKKLAHMCGFTAAEVELAGWLVKQQSLMSNIIFKRDLHDPATLHFFCKEIQSLEKLRLLLVLTAADIKAVGPKVWNSWKGGLLRDLYHMCEEFISTGSIKTHSNSIEHLRLGLHETLSDWTDAQREHYLWQGHNAYFSSRDAHQHAIVARMLREGEATQQPFLTHFQHAPSMDYTELTVCSPDRKGLLADVAAAISCAGQNIINATVFTLKNGWGVQTWHIQTPSQHILDESSYPLLIHYISGMIEQSSYCMVPELQFQSRTPRDTFDIPPHIYIENHASNSHTIIEITAADRMGLLHTICRTLQLESLNISSAHINTYGEKAVDVFYVRDAYGMKIMHPKKIEQIIAKLTLAIAPPREDFHFNYII